MKDYLNYIKSFDSCRCHFPRALAAVRIVDVGAAAIVNAIKENVLSSLYWLNLSNNNIGITGGISIAAMLTNDESLIDLNLGDNANIATEGVIAIANALKRNALLKTLTLSGIPLGDDGAMSIAAMLTTNISLRELNVDCTIGGTGVIAIADVLKTNKSLEYLSLCYNANSNSVIIIEIAAMLQRKTSKKILCLRNDIDIDDSTVRVLLNTLEEYNDTHEIFVCRSRVVRPVSNSLELCSRGNSLELCLRGIGSEKRRGIRCAPFKHRRKFYNCLQLVWIRKSTS